MLYSEDNYSKILLLGIRAVLECNVGGPRKLKAE